MYRLHVPAALRHQLNNLRSPRDSELQSFEFDDAEHRAFRQQAPFSLQTSGLDGQMPASSRRGSVLETIASLQESVVRHLGFLDYL